MTCKAWIATVFATVLVAWPGASAGAAPLCKSGFVYREAYPNDTVCVVPGTRARVRADNAAAASRIRPGGGPYGPNTCRDGFVWREARPGDLVCVTPAQRALTNADNRAAASRYAQRRGPAPRRSPVTAVDRNGNPLAPGASNIAQCKLGGAKCPARMLPAYDEMTQECLCKAQ